MLASNLEPRASRPMPAPLGHSLQVPGRPLQSITCRKFYRIGSRMETPDTHKQLIAKLMEELGPATAQHLVFPPRRGCCDTE